MRKKFLATLIPLAIIVFNAIPVHATVLTSKGLYAGKWLYPVGTVTVAKEDNNLVVTYLITAPSWVLTETHLYLGLTPPTRGSPGKFPYTHDNVDPASDEYTVPLPAGYSGLVYIAAHAVVQKDCLEETAWTCGSWINPRKGWGWGTYFSVYIE